MITIPEKHGFYNKEQANAVRQSQTKSQNSVNDRKNNPYTGIRIITRSVYIIKPWLVYHQHKVPYIIALYTA